MSKQDLMLLLTAERAVVSTGRGGKSQLVSRPRNASADAAEEVDALLAALPFKPGKVWILCSDLWTGSVSLDNEVLRRVEKRHLPQMIAYEVEPLSGINASAARTGITLLESVDGEPHFWVTQAEVSQFNSFAEAVEFNGGRLQGLLHPAGLPLPLTPGVSAATAWGRLELFGDTAILIYRDGKSIQRRFYADGASLAYNTDQLEALRQEVGSDSFEILSDSASGAVPSYVAKVHTLSLDNDATVAAWLQGWQRSLAGKAAAPTIVPERQPMTVRTRRFVTAGIFAVTLIACAGLHLSAKHWNAARAAALRQEISETRGPIEAAKTQTTKLSQLEKSLAEIEAKQQALEKAIDKFCSTMDAQRRRVPGLLKSLATASDEQLLIQEIECDGAELKIHGRCLQPQQAKTLAARLARDLSVMGFSVELPMTEALNLTTNGGPHQFQVIVRDKNS